MKRLVRPLMLALLIVIAVGTLFYASDSPRQHIRWLVLLLASVFGAVSAYLEYRDPTKSTKHVALLTSLLAIGALLLEGIPKTADDEALASLARFRTWQDEAIESARSLTRPLDTQLAHARARLPTSALEAAIAALNPRIRAGEEIVDGLAESYYLRGSSEWHLKRLSAAKPSLQRAIDLDGAQSAYYARYCEALQQLKDKATINTCKRAVELDGKNGEAWNALGKAHMTENMFGDAKASFEIAARLMPRSPKPWTNLGLAAYMQGHNEEALAYLNESLRRYANFENALVAKGAVLRAMKRFAEAVDIYRRALGLNPDDEFLWNNLGNAYFDLGQPDAAFRAYDSALLLRPDYADCLFNYGRRLNLVNRHQEAIQYLRQAAELEPKDLEAYVEMIKAYEKLGRAEEVSLTIRSAAAAGNSAQDLAKALAAAGLTKLALKIDPQLVVVPQPTPAPAKKHLE